MIKDFIIVGQGLIGTVLSHTLLKEGYSIHVFNTPKENSASRIAAGVYNPVTYRKLKMAEFADFLLPEVNAVYPEIEKLTNTSFLAPDSFLKLITDIEELNNWQIQSGQEKNSPFMSSVIVKNDFEQTINSPFGAGEVLQSGVVKIPLMLDAWKKYLLASEILEETSFEYDQLNFENGTYIYKGVQSKRIVFCEGVGVVDNPWFKWLPMQKFKGEVLEISAPTLKLDKMVNRGVFILPQGNGVFKVGATHNWKEVNEIPTEEGKAELLEKLEKIINVPYQIISHNAGLRPATRDRHPYIGVHPDQPNMFVVNGTGSKGVIIAPWLVQTFIKGLETHEWPKTFNISRYHRFYNQND